MIEFLGWEFIHNYGLLGHENRLLAQRRLADGSDAPLDETEIASLSGLVTELRNACATIEMGSCSVLATDCLALLQQDAPTCGDIIPRLESLHSLIHYELMKQRFVFVPMDRHALFEQDNLFRFSRSHPFPSARADIKAAGTCLALGLETATIFHLMRVAEIGLRTLAKHLRVRLRDHKRQLPVEWAQWEKVLNGIKTAIDQRYPQSGKPKRTQNENREFYNGLWAEFLGFKDMYRNNVMHVRKTYSFHEASAALEHVGAFMRRLSTRVHE